MLRLFLLTVGGGLGTLIRYLINGLVSNRSTPRLGWAAIFPLGTLVVNFSGCFLIGLLAPLALRSEWRLFLMVGFCGGYTTFSSFGLQTFDLARDGEWLAVAVNVIGTNVLCLGAVYLGIVCGRFIHGGNS